MLLCGHFTNLHKCMHISEEIMRGDLACKQGLHVQLTMSYNDNELQQQ
jgi:hypothetical protein